MLAMRDLYNVRRRSLVKGLNSISLPVFEPCGAFDAFPDIRDEFAMTLLEEE